MYLSAPRVGTVMPDAPKSDTYGLQTETRPKFSIDYPFGMTEIQYSISESSRSIWKR
jgi:hypothetical protein